MMNQLLLAQVLAEGTENVLTLNNLWPVFVGPLVTFASPYLGSSELSVGDRVLVGGCG